MRRPAVIGIALALVAAGLVADALTQPDPPPAPTHRTPVVTARLTAQDELRRRGQALIDTGAVGFQARIHDGRRVSTVAVGLADRGTRRPLRDTDRFEADAQTSTFAAVLTLQLVAQRKVLLDKPIENYLPGVVPGGRDITVRMLLQHTSGLADYAADTTLRQDVVARPGTPMTTGRLLAAAFAQEPGFAPGSDWSYSGTNYVVIGQMLEKVTGRPLEDLVRERITEPLQLHDTHVTRPGSGGADAGSAHGYTVNLTTTPATWTDTTGWASTWSGGAGAIVSTSDDLGTFFRALLSGRVLPRAQLKQMMTTRTVEGGGYGLGLSRFVTPCGQVWGESGYNLGHASLTVVTEDGRRSASADINTARGEGDGTSRPERAFDRASGAALATTYCQMQGKELPLSMRQ
ncbi:beta-lactamase family protein [Kineosporia sp. J2-2]|uniref:Beta-lactamase family protein n=1 Tax=Kineosporia corallincola TaxID=2835133 RepID=A0ABS5TMG9_9ACTN|nr:serine hydrolase domain-containing protein [Kineosporia corallincola]MBT0771569.1 beta-lactamase family protein [Kineosporia corallincola]